tara:strand:+ start:139 stop:513 length:375 start_codon:yes stop_codon:yes gene_type:complete
MRKPLRRNFRGNKNCDKRVSRVKFVKQLSHSSHSLCIGERKSKLLFQGWFIFHSCEIRRKYFIPIYNDCFQYLFITGYEEDVKKYKKTAKGKISLKDDVEKMKKAFEEQEVMEQRHFEEEQVRK